jgi:hypothetical protein
MRQHLDSHVLIQRGLVSFVDRGHATRTDLFDDAVLSQGLTDEIHQDNVS